jgi:arsenite methyltransferase
LRHNIDKYQYLNQQSLEDCMNQPATATESGDVRTTVRERYGAIAEQGGGCCGPADSGCCGSSNGDVIQLASVTTLYDDPGVVSLPADVTDLSLGCGDPVTLASLQPGQTVLDLGSGGGIDCFLAARKVGPTGRVLGVDMTPAMIDRARRNQAKVGADNVEFRLGEIEHLPVADNTVDVIISNCVVNLSPDKPQVFREAYRVLKPGGRLAVSDIVTDGPLPDAIKNDLAAWAGCVAGALDVADYVAAIEAAGFVDVELVPVYWEPDMVAAAVDQLGDAAAQAAQSGQLNTAVFSAKITAWKR